jgi:hypothetical protein
MKRHIQWIGLVLVCFLLGACGLSLQGWPTGQPAGGGGKQTFRCQGPGMVIAFTSGTADFPGSVTVQNLLTQHDSTRPVAARTPAAGGAAAMVLACGDVAVKCGNESNESVRICGDANAIQVQAVNIVISESSFPKD